MIVDHPPAGWSLTPHRHANEAETIHVVDGVFAMELDGARTQLSAGQTIHVARGVVHSSANVGPELGQRVVIFSPAGVERFFLEAGAPERDSEPDIRAAFAAALRHGWEFVPQRSPPLTDRSPAGS